MYSYSSTFDRKVLIQQDTRERNSMKTKSWLPEMPNTHIQKIKLVESRGEWNLLVHKLIPEMSHRDYLFLVSVLEVLKMESCKCLISCSASQRLGHSRPFPFSCVRYTLALQCRTNPFDKQYPISWNSTHLDQDSSVLPPFRDNTLQYVCKFFLKSPTSFDIDRVISFYQEICLKLSERFVSRQYNLLSCWGRPLFSTLPVPRFLHGSNLDLWISSCHLSSFLHSSILKSYHSSHCRPSLQCISWTEIPNLQERRCNHKMSGV